MSTDNLEWISVGHVDDLPEGRVKPVTCEKVTVCMTHYEGRYAALDNRCPHQGGPLGEGSIEEGWLRCPWHGWDYHPTTGRAPGFDDGVETFRALDRDRPDLATDLALVVVDRMLGGESLIVVSASPGGRWRVGISHPEAAAEVAPAVVTAVTTTIVILAGATALGASSCATISSTFMVSMKFCVCSANSR